MNQEEPPPIVAPPGRPKPGTDTVEGALRWVFVGDKGIRAGWSLLIFFAAMALSIIPIAIAFTRFRLSFPENDHAYGTVLSGETLILLMVAAGTYAMSRIERKPFLSYGFVDKKALLRLFSGLICGFLALSVLIGLLAAGGWIKFDGVALHGAEIFKYGASWGIAFVVLAITEESLFRGYPQYALQRGLNFWWAAGITSVVFAVTHWGNPGENFLGVVQVLAAGLVFVLSLRMSGSLFWAVGLHAGWDWAQSFFYGTPDSGNLADGHFLKTHPVGDPLWSGGSAGPEGSLLSLVVLAAVAAGIWLYWRPKTSR